MYRIYSGSTILHHPNSPFIAEEAKISEEINTQGSLDMVLVDPLSLNLRDPIEVYDDDGLIWRGRVMSIENGLNRKKTVHCEGALAFLCDTIVRPFSFRGRPDDDTSATPTVNGLFHHFIDIHNSELPSGDPRKFTIGEITVTDPNNYIYRSSETAMTTWEAIQTRLIDTLGGYVYLSGPNLNIINYVSDFSAQSAQEIRFGENIVDLLQTDSAEDIVTVLYAYGAQYPEEDTDHYEPEPDTSDGGYEPWDGNRLFAVFANLTAKDKWGVINGTNTWDDITLLENLETAANAWLADNFASHVESLEVTAADLSLLEASMDKLSVGVYVRVLCERLDIDLNMLCVRKETDLIQVSETRVSIGRAPTTMSGMVGG